MRCRKNRPLHLGERKKERHGRSFRLHTVDEKRRHSTLSKNTNKTKKYMENVPNVRLMAGRLVYITQVNTFSPRTRITRDYLSSVRNNSTPIEHYVTRFFGRRKVLLLALLGGAVLIHSLLGFLLLLLVIESESLRLSFHQAMKIEQ